jgi:hypothetical protein
MFDPQTAPSRISRLLALCLRLFARARGRAPMALTRAEAVLARAIRATAAEIGIATPDLDDAALIAWFNAARIAPAASAPGGLKKAGFDKSEDGQSVFGHIGACAHCGSVFIAQVGDGRRLRPRAWPRGRRLNPT